MNLVFWYKMYRTFPHPHKEGEWVADKIRCDGYFHAKDMACIRNLDKLRCIQIEDMYMLNETFLYLDSTQLRELERRQHLEAIVNTQRKLKLQR